MISAGSKSKIGTGRIFGKVVWTAFSHPQSELSRRSKLLLSQLEKLALGCVWVQGRVGIPLQLSIASCSMISKGLARVASDSESPMKLCLVLGLPQRWSGVDAIDN